MNITQFIKYLNKTKKWAAKSMEDMERLGEVTDLVGNNDMKGIISLFYAYLYRNLYLCSIKLKDGDELEWLEKSKDERYSLKRYFQPGTIDSQLYNTFQMEYYLTLTEYMGHAEGRDIDEDDLESYSEEIEMFLKESKKQNDHARYISRIELLYHNL